MGTWSNRPFGNDTASDWALKLVAESGDGMISDALEIETNAEIDASKAECAVAAAAVVAGASSEPPRGVSAELKSWIRKLGYVPSHEIVKQSIAAIDAITESSELRDLWDESDALDGWLRTTRKIRDQLRAALDNGLPARSPKKPAMPRNFNKLIERFREDPDPKVLERIRNNLEKMEDPEKPTRQTGHRRPIYLLATAGLISEIQHLIDRGVDVRQDSLSRDTSPLLGACRFDQLDTVRFLVKAGAPIVQEEERDQISGSEKWLYDHDPESWVDAHEHEPEWYTFRYSQPLWFAVHYGSIEMVEYLLDAGADIQQQDVNGETLLHKASQAGRCDVMEYLVEKGFDVNADSISLEAPIFKAIRNGQVEAVRWLAEHGADVNALSWLGGAPLDWSEHSPEIAAVLREHGARERPDERREGASAPSA